MKTLMQITGRTLILLAIAALVSGIIYFGAQATGLTAEGGTGDNGALMQPPTGAMGGTGEAMRPMRDHGDEEGASLMAAVEIVKNIVIIAVIVLVVTGGQALWAFIAKKRRMHPAIANVP